MSASSAVFDPLRLISPFVLRAKLLLQRLWEQGLEWDEAVGESDLEEWLKWCAELNELKTLHIPHCLWPTNFKVHTLVLHTFCDASERAFAAVVYLQVTSEEGQVHVSLVMSKTRVAPVKRHCLTLPRLELQAAVLGARLHESVKSELDLSISESYFWTDSLIVLQYISNDSTRLKTFVANRVSEVRQLTNVEQWRFVPGLLNPADDGSRGLSAADLQLKGRWLKGPEFLWSEESPWPVQAPLRKLSDDSLGLKRVNVLKHVEATIVEQCEPLLEPTKFSQLSRLQRVTAWCFRFVEVLRLCVEKRRAGKGRAEAKYDEIQRGGLTVLELDKALIYWIKVAQHEAYLPEIRYLTSGEPLPKHSNLLNLSPVMLDGVLSVGGRLRNAILPFAAHHQAIVPREHVLAKLLVIAVHQRIMHSGSEHTIAEIRQAYWIVRLRTLVKAVIRACLYCSAQRARPSVPFMSDLPLARVSMNVVFNCTGLDYFGPMNVKRGLSKLGTLKRWGCLFTCLATRAVHLELVASLDTDSFILALRRFIARRGNPSHVYSDRGTNFVGAVSKLKSAIRSWHSDGRVQNILANNAIQWHFNPPKAPHMGGAWERLVHSVKKALRATLQNALVHEDTLHTTLCEIEALINSRPLTYVASTPSEPEPLTPNHFLLNRTGRVSAESDDGISSRKRWRQCQFLTDHFWRRWRKEYLPTLTIRSRWLSETRNLAKDDVVLIMDHNAPRGHWPLGRVMELLPGRDGRVRVVKVKTASGELIRPAAQICLLEEVRD
jgi:hypothetical protein